MSTCAVKGRLQWLGRTSKLSYCYFTVRGAISEESEEDMSKYFRLGGQPLVKLGQVRWHYISQLAKDHLGIPQEKLEGAVGKKSI